MLRRRTPGSRCAPPAESGGKKKERRSPAFEKRVAPRGSPLVPFEPGRAPRSGTGEFFLSSDKIHKNTPLRSRKGQQPCRRPPPRDRRPGGAGGSAFHAVSPGRTPHGGSARPARPGARGKKSPQSPFSKKNSPPSAARLLRGPRRLSIRTQSCGKDEIRWQL